MGPRETALRSLLSGTEFRALEILVADPHPATGRSVARALGVSPTTASSVLAKLLEAGFALRERDGRSFRWELNRLDPTIQGWLFEFATPSAGPHKSSVMKVLILTALNLECSAVLEHVSIEEHTHAGAYRLHQGTFQGKNVAWSVYVAEIGIGNINAGVVLASVAPLLLPDLVLFVGVAGSLKPDVLCRGDVVIPQHVFQLGAGKEAFSEPEGSVLLNRYIPAVAKTAVVQLARAVAHGDWMNEQIRVRPDVETRNVRGETPVALVAPMAAGERVLTDDKSELVRGLRENLNDVAAVDMESGGVYSAAHALEIPALSVRGISDHVIDKEPPADQEWQPVAAAHASSFAFALLREAGLQDIAGPLRPPAAEPPSGDGALTVREMLFRLPPNVAVAYSWGERVGATGTERLVAELYEHREYATKWLDELTSRSTSYHTPDAAPTLFMLAEFAEAHEHGSADLIIEQAARLANQGSARGLLLARAAWSARLRGKPERSDQLLAEATRAFPEAEALWQFFEIAFRNEPGPVLDISLSVAATLGVHLSALPGRTAQPDPALSSLVSRMDIEAPELVDLLRVLVALVAANALRLLHEYSSALRLYNAFGQPGTGPGDRHIVWDSLVGPRNAVLPLETARTLYMMIAEPEPGLDVDLVLAKAVELALTARDRRLDWNGPTSDPLALAAELRARAGDPKGALRLLLPPPRGTALPTEATAQQVLAVTAEIAFLTGDVDLTLELAKRLPDPIEQRLIGGLALASRPDSRLEAAAEFRAALAEPEIASRPNQRVRALVGLTMVSELRAEDEVHLNGLDDTTRNLVQAQSLVMAGRGAEARALMRPHRGSFPELQISVEVLVSQGRTKEAVDALEGYATHHGEERLLLQAAGLARSAGLLDDAERLASRVAAGQDQIRRRTGIEMLVDIAQQRGDWPRTIQETGRLLVLAKSSEPGWEEAALRYRWARVNAFYQLRDAESAYIELEEDPPLDAITEAQALLTVDVLRAIAPLVPEGDTGLTIAGRTVRQSDVLRRASAIAKAFSDKEEIVAAALLTSFLMPAQGPVNPADLIEARELQDLFFTRFPESKLVERVHFSSPEELEQIVYERVAASAGLLNQVRKGVFVGQVPLASYAAVAQRSYAQALVQNAVGVYLIESPLEANTAIEVAAARAAIDREVVVDTSTLFLAEKVLGNLSELARRFEHLVLPAPLRDDVLSARAALAMRSVGSFGWDPIEDRPIRSFHDEALTDSWAREANRLVDALKICEVLPDTNYEGDPRNRAWSSAVRMAKEREIALLADDAALRQVARNEGVQAFGTLQLLRALVEDEALALSALDDALEGLQRMPAVDLPLLDRLQEIATRDQWLPTGYAAVLLTRPNTWTPPSQGLQSYMNLIQAIPTRDADVVSQWCAIACYGIAIAVPPPLALVSIGSVVAWTTLDWRGPEILPRVLERTRRVALEFAPGGDLLQDVVQRLTTTLRQIVSPEMLSGLMQQLFAELDEETRHKAFGHFLTTP